MVSSAELDQVGDLLFLFLFMIVVDVLSQILILGFKRGLLKGENVR